MPMFWTEAVEGVEILAGRERPALLEVALVGDRGGVVEILAGRERPALPCLNWDFSL